jgi:hypothetical protein
MSGASAGRFWCSARNSGILFLQSYNDEALVSQSLRPGMEVPAEFGVRTADGQKATIIFASSVLPTIAYVFRPSCVWFNSTAINTLAAQTLGRYRLVGLSLSEDGLSEFVKEHLPRPE